MLNSGQDFWSASSSLTRDQISNAHRDFKQAENLLEHYQNRPQKYWLAFIDIHVCLAENYRLAAMDRCRAGDRDLAAKCLTKGQNYLHEAHEKIDMVLCPEKSQYQISLERLFLEEASIHVKSSSGVIDDAAVGTLLKEAVEFQGKVHSALKDYSNIRARAQDLVGLVNEDLKMIHRSRTLPS